MRTSPKQFEIMIKFMEENGDINWPARNPQERMKNILNWEFLTNQLNSDPTGERKITEKWKKVWSDFKNNTKRKAAKLSRIACGTVKRPAVQAKLTELEQRTLNLIRSRASTGLPGVVGADFSQEQGADADRTVTILISPTSPTSSGGQSPSMFTAVPAVDSPVKNIDFSACDVWDLPGTSQQTNPIAITTPSPATSPAMASGEPQDRTSASPSPHRPALHGYAPRRRQRGLTTRRVTATPKWATRLQSYLEQTTQDFLRSDEEWRKFAQKKHEDDCDLEREKLEMKEIELQAKQKWQDIAMHALEVLQKIIESKLCKE